MPEMIPSAIDDLLANQQSQDEEYLSLISVADQLFKEKKYAEAKIKYEEALAIKPGEKYPQEKIDQIIAILALATSQNSEYDEAILEADGLLEKKRIGTANYYINRPLFNLLTHR